MESQPTAPEAPLLPLCFLQSPTMLAADGFWPQTHPSQMTSLILGLQVEPSPESFLWVFLTLPALKTEPWDARAVCPSRQGSGISSTGVGTKRLDFAAFIAPASDRFIVNMICAVGLHAVHP